ncbi:inner membrane protein [Klebsiella oxytoca]|nr:inner membrane protein [Klebsiella oxytoca]
MRADKSLKPFEIRLYRHYRIVHGVRIALAFVLTFVLVRLLNVPEGTWPLITPGGGDGAYLLLGKRRPARV